MRTRFIESGGAELATAAWGNGGTPIVALHPGVADLRIWQWCAPVWAGAGFRTVAYDRRGYGSTRYHEAEHDDLADLLAVIEATASRPGVIVGNSLGGGLALDLAVNYPDHAAALVLIAPAVSGYPDDDWPLTEAEGAQDDLVEQAEASGDLDIVNRLEVRYWLDGTEQPEGRVSGRARDLMFEMNGTALRAASTGRAVRHEPVWERAGDMTVPTLVIAGAFDLPGIRQTCTRLADRMPQARLETMAETAHCPSLDQPDKLNNLVLDFLKSNT